MTRSTLGVYVFPAVLLGVGGYLRRHVSRILGTLVMVAMALHLMGWIALYFYARWLFRDGWDS